MIAKASSINLFSVDLLNPNNLDMKTTNTINIPSMYFSCYFKAQTIRLNSI